MSTEQPNICLNINRINNLKHHPEGAISGWCENGKSCVGILQKYYRRIVPICQILEGKK